MLCYAEFICYHCSYFLPKFIPLFDILIGREKDYKSAREFYQERILQLHVYLLVCLEREKGKKGKKKKVPKERYSSE